MKSIHEMLDTLGERFGVLSQSNTHQLKVVAKNLDVAVGDLFLLPSHRGERDRIYIFKTNQYANILNRSLEMDDIAQNKVSMPDSYLSEDLAEEKLIELIGIVLGYSEFHQDEWTFHQPRRLPEHLSDVYRVDPQIHKIAEVVNTLLISQFRSEGLCLGHLLVGEEALTGVDVYLPPFALSHHLGVFGKTGAGKSNLMMVLLKAVMDHNKRLYSKQSFGPKSSVFAIDPHDEFKLWHESEGRTNGIAGIIEGYSDKEKAALVDPFFYLTAKATGSSPYDRRILFSRADILPDDLISITEFSEQQIAFAHQQFSQWGEAWIGRLLLGDTQAPGYGDSNIEYLPGTVSAVQRRLGFLRQGQTRIISPFDPDIGKEYESLLPDIICSLERGRVLIIDTTLISELEQFLLTTIVARTLFTLRKALKSVESPSELPKAIEQAFGVDESIDQKGLFTVAKELIRRVDDGTLPYIQQDRVCSIEQLPLINIVVEEAPSVLNPQRMKFGSVFRDISRQGRKFGIGLTVVSQQVSEIDKGILSQINTELIMSLGNEEERKKAISNASVDMTGFEKELQVMSKGQVIVAASYQDIPLAIQVPDFDTLMLRESNP